MYAYLEGLVAERQVGSLVIDCGGVGYWVFTTPAVVGQCKVGEKFKVYTRLSVKEDGMDLYGFSSKEERDMFDKLTAVSGIGPRMGLAILSHLSVQDLSLALVTSDAKALTKVPGVGPKLAQRMVLELKDKISESDFAASDTPVLAAMAEGNAVQDAIEALMALGYSGTEASKAVGAVKDQSDKTDQIVTMALRHMALGR